jgi:hypothetical protein
LTILEDVAQKREKHTIKNEYWKSKNIEVKRLPIPCGDYVIMNEKIQDVITRKSHRGLDVKKIDLLGTIDISVDTKEDMQELYQNLINSHDRFRDELVLAQNSNVKLIILTENTDGITCIEDVANWFNPRFPLWERDIRKVFVDLQKQYYKHDNAMTFFDKRDIDIRAGLEDEIPKDFDKFVHDQYFKQLKCISIEEILLYFKSKKVAEYLKLNDIKIKKKPASSEQLVKSMLSMQEKYGVEFLFCTPEDSGRVVVELLTK